LGIPSGRAPSASSDVPATVDCYNESEQVMGLYTMIEDNLALPFETTVLGVPVVVERVDLTQREEIVVLCLRGGGVVEDASDRTTARGA